MESIRWTGEHLELLDQRRLPTEEVWLTLQTDSLLTECVCQR